jgi:hypothetical protein
MAGRRDAPPVATAEYGPIRERLSVLTNTSSMRSSLEFIDCRAFAA